MSKKKATMTLKDFHGGCIPSDLLLPSAPGVTRGGFDQQASRGTSVGRTDQRLRPASAGSARNLDEKAPFLSHSSNIGRNFDEDERKPLDGLSGPRRTVGDEFIRSQSSSLREPKIDNQSGSRVGSRPASVPVPQTNSLPGSSYVGRVGESNSTRLDNQAFTGSHGYGLNYPSVGGNAGQAMIGPHPNAWGVRKEMASSKDPVSAAKSTPDPATKLAHASALEKVSSGRWSLKQPVHPLKDSEALGRLETGRELVYGSSNSFNKRTYNRLDVADNVDPDDVVLAMHAERSLVVDDAIYGSGKEVSTYERSKSAVLMEPNMRNSSISVNGFQSFQPTGKSGGSEYQSTLPSESSERPKLKLLPRSKPLENMETAADCKQKIDHHLVEDNYVALEPKNRLQSGFTGSVVGDRAPERPKLNLKPRTQPLEHPEGNDENKRGTVFGGARPREVVLKERGIDEDVSHYENQLPLRIKEGGPKTDTFTHVTTVCYPEKPDSIPTDQKIAKYSDRRDHHHDGERIEPQGKNRQNDIRRGNRDLEKHRNQQQKQLPDRPPSPETWRKPVEQVQAKHACPDAPPVRYGKAASAVELAQAFSKSVSNPSTSDRFSGPRGIPNRSNQVQFSRLVGPTARPQINGY